MTGKLLITGLHSVICLRVNDKFLMDTWDEESLPIQTLQILNYCRMYLKVTRISDIATNDGNYIQTAFIQGTQINTIPHHDWPRQQKPSKKAWKLWNFHLRKSFYSGSKLSHPLGIWLKTSNIYDTVYIPEINQIQKTTARGTFTAQVRRTRTTLTNCCNW